MICFYRSEVDGGWCKIHSGLLRIVMSYARAERPYRLDSISVFAESS